MSCEEARERLVVAGKAWRAVEAKILEVTSAPAEGGMPRIFSAEQGELLRELNGELDMAAEEYASAAKAFFQALLSHSK